MVQKKITIKGAIIAFIGLIGAFITLTDGWAAATPYLPFPTRAEFNQSEAIQQQMFTTLQKIDRKLDIDACITANEKIKRAEEVLRREPWNQIARDLIDGEKKKIAYIPQCQIEP